MDFIRGQNTPTFLETLISKYDFGPVKLPGVSRNGPQRWEHIQNISVQLRLTLCVYSKAVSILKIAMVNTV